MPKNYGEADCLWCHQSFIKNSSNQLYCKRTHEAICSSCQIKHIFTGSPQWLKGINNKNILYQCKNCSIKSGSMKRKQTKIERYGDATYNNRDKAFTTMTEKYGAKTTLESSLLTKKFEETMKKKYGAKRVKNSSKSIVNSASHRAKKQKISLENSIKISELFLNEQKFFLWLNDFRETLHKDKVSYAELSLELGCSPSELSHFFSKHEDLKKEFIKVNDSRLELIVVNYIEKEYGLKVSRRVKPVRGFEIDIYLPSVNVGFEVNDFATHSIDSDCEKSSFLKSEGRVKHGPVYHNNKVKFCLENNIVLVHLWENEIISGDYQSKVDEALERYV